MTGRLAAGVVVRPAAFLLSPLEPRSGMRGLVHLRAILGNIGVLVLPDQVTVPAAHNAFDGEGSIVAHEMEPETYVEIDEPDDELLIGVMTKLFADRQIAVDASVIRYIASRIERSLASSRLIVERLDELGALLNKPARRRTDRTRAPRPALA